KSSENVADDTAMDIGETEVAAGVAVGQSFVVEAHEVQDRGVQVVDVDPVFHSAVAELVGGAVDHAALDAAAREPDAEAPVIVIASLRRPAVGELDCRRATELAAAQDQ